MPLDAVGRFFLEFSFSLSLHSVAERFDIPMHNTTEKFDSPHNAVGSHISPLHNVVGSMTQCSIMQQGDFCKKSLT
jgi:hypothetical protein